MALRERKEGQQEKRDPQFAGSPACMHCSTRANARTYIHLQASSKHTKIMCTQNRLKCQRRSRRWRGRAWTTKGSTNGSGLRTYASLYLCTGLPQTSYVALLTSTRMRSNRRCMYDAPSFPSILLPATTRTSLHRRSTGV